MTARIILGNKICTACFKAVPMNVIPLSSSLYISLGFTKCLGKFKYSCMIIFLEGIETELRIRKVGHIFFSAIPSELVAISGV